MNLMKKGNKESGMCRYLAGGALLLGTAAAVASPPQYTVIDLGTLGGELANALAINNHGVVVGQAETETLAAAHFVWADGVMTAVPGLNPNANGRADGINEHGHIAGSSMAPYPGGQGWVSHAFFWSPETGPVDLTPDSMPMSQGRALNNNRQVVGDAGGPQGGALLWEIDEHGNVTTTPLAMAGAPAGFMNIAYDINDDGVVVGVGYNEDFKFRAWKWEGSGAAVELPTLGGTRSVAEAVNHAGDIAGASELPTGQEVPVVWTADGSIIELGLLPVSGPVIGSEARGINNHRHVVGRELYLDPDTGLGVTAPWLWIDGQKWDLNDLIPEEDRDEWLLTTAIDINDAGQIVGIAIHTVDGVEYHGRAFLMTPVEAGNPYDVNGDGVVDIGDVLQVLSDWGSCDGCIADVNNDGQVDISDMLLVLANWG